MDTRAFLEHFIAQLHANYEQVLSGLTDEQLYWRPGGHANHIAFQAWHWLRTEDNVVQFALQRKNTVWLERGLNDAWGLPKVAQGTGMAPEEAHALRIPSAAALLDYAREVQAATMQYLRSASDGELARVTKIMPFGEIPVAQALGQTVLAHGNQHLGEIWLLRELQGLASAANPGA